MNHGARLLPSILISTICLQCVTPKAGTPLSKEKNLQIGCKYVSFGRNLMKSDVECSIQNEGSSPATVRFQEISVSDPASTIVPVDVSKIPNYEALKAIVVILGVVVVIGAIVALSTKSNYIGHVHVGVPDPPIPRTTVKRSSGTSSATFYDSAVIPPYRSIVLAFKVKHGAKRPDALMLYLHETPGDFIRVPIEGHLNTGGSRSNFDY
jgi:hypothetical protein